MGRFEKEANKTLKYEVTGKNLIGGSNYRSDTIKEEISGLEDKPEGITQNVAQRKKIK